MANLGPSDLAGIRIRQARTRKGWTAKDLADRCAEMGAPHITHTVITNLETRRRTTREITVDEMLVLARALDVPPIQVIAPLAEGEELEVVPGVLLDALEAVNWIGGDSPPDLLARGRVPGARGTDDLLSRTDMADPGPLTLIRLIRVVTDGIVRRDKFMTNHQDRPRNDDSADVRIAFAVDIAVLADRLMRLGVRMEALGYEPPGLESVAEILTRRGLPSSLAEWRERGADKDPDFDVDVVWPDGEG